LTYVDRTTEARAALTARDRRFLGPHRPRCRPLDALRGVLIYDGHITLHSGKTDALFVTARSYETECTLDLAVPYRNAASRGGFAVYRPKFQSFEPKSTDFVALAEAFFEGVEAHEKAAAVWDSHLDESQ
jgi:hypothetical protein